MVGQIRRRLTCRRIVKQGSKTTDVSGFLLVVTAAVFILYLGQHSVEEIDVAGKRDRAVPGEPVLDLRRVKERLEQPVVNGFRLQHEPLLLRPYVDGEAASWRC